MLDPARHDEYSQRYSKSGGYPSGCGGGYAESTYGAKVKHIAVARCLLLV